jgi:hypothetical protein
MRKNQPISVVDHSGYALLSLARQSLLQLFYSAQSQVEVLAFLQQRRG